jgi:regulator of protease activity HflC (stomatin/prohibitin superfamily)
MKKAWILILAVFLTGCGVAGIEDGQKGVKANFGKIEDQPVNTGWIFYCPLTTWVEVWNVKTQQIEETAQIPSSEGLISELDVSIIFHIPADKVVFVRKTVGREYIDTILTPYVREAIRNVASGYEVSSLYSEKGRTQISKEIKDLLVGKLENRGIVVEDILLRGVRLPPMFLQSIESKLRTEQESFQKEFELLKAKKDAEIEVAKAQGIAKSNKIIADSISENYLRYKFIENLNSTSKEVIYVPTEANLPILEATRHQQKPD